MTLNQRVFGKPRAARSKTLCRARRMCSGSKLESAAQAQLELAPIEEPRLGGVDLGTHCGEISIELTIIEGAQLHLHCVCSPDHSAWQLEERREPVPGGVSVGGR